MRFHIKFDGPPGPEAGRFVEVENALGESISLGDWRQVEEFWLLVFDSDSLPRSPVGIVLHCPHCGAQHVDAPEPERDWTNPPHRSHLCHGCGRVWRPSDVETNGVAQTATKGSRDVEGAPVYAIAQMAIAARVARRDFDDLGTLEGAEACRLEQVWQDAEQRLEDSVDELLDSAPASSAD